MERNENEKRNGEKPRGKKRSQPRPWKRTKSCGEEQKAVKLRKWETEWWVAETLRLPKRTGNQNACTRTTYPNSIRNSKNPHEPFWAGTKSPRRRHLRKLGAFWYFLHVLEPCLYKGYRYLSKVYIVNKIWLSYSYMVFCLIKDDSDRVDNCSQ